MFELKVEVGRKNSVWTSRSLHDVKGNIISLPLGDPSTSFDQFRWNPHTVQERLRMSPIPIEEFDKWSQGASIKKLDQHGFPPSETSNELK